jgi:hypothetical protein
MKTQQVHLLRLPLANIGKSRIQRPCVAETKRPMSSTTPSNKASAKAITYCTYGIGPPSWIKKEINTYALKRHIVVSIEKTLSNFLPMTLSNRHLNNERLIYTRT